MLHTSVADLSQMQYEIPEDDDEDEDEDNPNGVAEETIVPTAVENRKVTILLELLSAGNAIDARIAQFKDDIDLDMIQVLII